MELKDIIEKRKSVRSYTEEAVSDELVLRIIEAGHKAPTAGNLQPWDFIIVKEEQKKREIVNTTFVGNDRSSTQRQEWMLQAPVFIAVCADRDRCYSRYGDEGLKSLIYLDCAACIENMLLAVVDVGLASCWVSGFRKNELVSVLELPPSHEPIGVLPVGYSNDSSPRRPKRELSDIIHRETYFSSST